MTTTTAPILFIAKCHNKHVARYTEAQRDELRADWSTTKHGAMACPTCNATARFAPIKPKLTDTECGPRCTSAVGPACDCKCGGENHASDYAA